MKAKKVVLILLTFFLLSLGFFHKITAMNQDLGRHFLLGDIVLKTLNVPGTNLFSYTYPNFPFINLHWLSEVIFFLIFKGIGFNGLLFFSTLIILLAFLIVFLKAYKKNLIPITIGSMLYFGILFERTEIRPEIFSFLFLAIFTVILYGNREKATKLIFFLPLIELLWVNMHIYFAIGLSVIGLFFVESMIMKRKEIFSFFKKKASFPKNTLYFLIVLILSVIAASINPNGLKGLLYPLYFWQNYGYPIEENQNILFLWQLFQLPTIIYFAVSSLLLFTFLFINYKKSRLIDWLLSLFFVFVGYLAIRNLPLFVFGTFIAFVYNLSFLYKRIPLKLDKFIYALVLFVLLFQIFSVSKTKAIGFGVDEGAKAGADFFLRNELKGPIFNNFDIGSYLDYRFYPKKRVFVDGRPGEYPADFFKNVYIPMQQDPSIFKEVEKKYKFNVVFVNYLDQTPWANQFLKNITNDPSWKPVYLDDFVFILVKDTPQNATIIKKYGFSNDNAPVDISNNNDKNSLLRLAIFSSKVGWMNLGEKSLKKLLLLDPNNCNALSGLISILQAKNDITANIYLTRWSSFCR
jgi:hypothetical protein